MKPFITLQTVAPSQIPQPNFSVESSAQIPETMLANASPPMPVPLEDPEDIDTGYYNQHWGINE